ncbi:MAG: hypothetical protein ACO4CG_15590, partial [Prochlorothrix sp.]
MSPLNYSRPTPRVSTARVQRSRPPVQQPSRSDLRYHARVAIDTLLVQSKRLKQDLDSLQVQGVVWNGVDTIYRSALGLLQLTQPEQANKAVDWTIDRHGITDFSQPPSKRLVHLILHTCASLLQDFGGPEFIRQVQCLQGAAQQLHVMLDLIEQSSQRPQRAALVPIPRRSNPDLRHRRPRPNSAEPQPNSATLPAPFPPIAAPKPSPLTLVPPETKAPPAPVTPGLPSNLPAPAAPPSPELFSAGDLPLKPPSVPPLQVLSPNQVTANPAPHPPRATGATILVVDDSRTNRELLSQYLTQ